MKILAIAALLAGAVFLCSQPSPREQVGPLPNGAFLLNSGWKLTPAGKQVPVDTLPMSSALSPDGKYLLVLNGGYRAPSISVIDVAKAEEVSRTKVPDAWLGLAFTPKGDRVYVGGGSKAAVFEFTFAQGELKAARTFAVAPEAKRTVQDFIGDVALSPDGRLLYAADLFHDSLAVINPQSGMVIERVKTGRRPYRILFHPDGKSFFVTSWTDGTLGHHDVETRARLSLTRLGAHPTDMVWRAGKPDRIYVAAANTNAVYSVTVSEGKELRNAETINVSMTPRQPLGMTPSALSLAADGKRMFVACSDANAVAVVEFGEERSHVAGFVPTGWYPTAVRALADGRLLVLNSRGLRSYPNPHGPSPAKKAAPVHSAIPNAGYVGSLQTGTVSFIDPLTDASLYAYSRQVLANAAYSDEKLATETPLPPIRHVIYVVKENRTYDQVLGDMKEGNGDPSLVLFGENVSPNHHKLAREFVLFDNFYVNSDVSADGHHWSTAAIAPDYVQKMWPNSYAGRRKLSDYAGQEPTATPPAGFLWTSAASAGVSMRNFGYYVNNRKAPGPDGVQVDSVRDPILSRCTNPYYRGFDVEHPDQERAKAFLKEFAQYEQAGQMPALIFMRLGNDHTAGTKAGATSPLSQMADNDYALGQIVDAVSHSKFWGSTAIFVLEDDAQNGPDHVDSHRSPAYIISAYSKRRFVDGTMYNTTSMLRTMELILGLRPMTHFDAGARVMNYAFQGQPDLTAYTAEKPRISLTDRNPAATATAARSAKMDFSEEDRVDDDELNEVLWLAIRKTEPPPPVRSYFAR